MSNKPRVSGYIRQLIIAPFVGMLLIGIPAFMLASAPATPAGQLERTAWTVSAEPARDASASEESAFVDTLIFKRGKMGVEGQREAGFKPSPYTLTATGYGWSLTAEQQSVERGQMTWTGELTGQILTGTLVWTKPDGSVARFTFRAEQTV